MYKVKEEQLMQKQVSPTEWKGIQLELSKRIVKQDDFNLENIRTIGGMDITFKDLYKNPTKAWVSIVIVDINTMKQIYEKIIETVIEVPYKATFLAFRELPLLLEIYNQLEQKPDIFMIDGHGYAHPRRLGIASHFGVLTNEVTIGVAKRILCGRHERLTYNVRKKPIIYNDETIGMARANTHSSRIYISIGNRISLDTAVEVTEKCCKPNERIPYPIKLAHNLLQPVRRKNLALM